MHPDEQMRTRLDALYAEGRAVSAHFEATVRAHEFHPFVAADYNSLERGLAELYQPGLRFLEWGSGTGVITITAAILGYDASGIELDGDLVRIAQDLAARHEPAARFAEGSFLPDDYEWVSESGDRRLGTIGTGPSGYAALGRGLDQFDLIFGYPWGGEDTFMRDLFRDRAGADARLIMFGRNGVEVFSKADLTA